MKIGQVKAVKEDKNKTVGIMTNDDAFGWKKKGSRRSRKSSRDLGLGHMARRQNLLLV